MTARFGETGRHRRNGPYPRTSERRISCGGPSSPSRFAQVLVALAGVLLDRDAYVDQLAHDLSARDPSLTATRSTIELVLYGGIAIGVAIGIALGAP